MLEDFHFYSVAVLARAAGFPAEDALVIAYASQYVDHATESHLIRLHVNGTTLRFDPVRTAHYGLGTINWSTQKRIFIPFHFLPPEPFQPGEQAHFSFITKAGSRFAYTLIQQAAAEPLENHTRRLCRLGVALHTFADSWAHQTFSGRYSPGENDVGTLEIFNRARGAFHRSSVERLLLELAPQIGHAEAGLYPDLAYVRWRYAARHFPDEVYSRDNTTAFLAAAHAIWDVLSSVEKVRRAPTIDWEKLQPEFKRLFSREPSRTTSLLLRWLHPLRSLLRTRYLESTRAAWQATYAALFEAGEPGYNYSRETWRRKALKGRVDWDRVSRSAWSRMPPFDTQPDFWDSCWVHFHRAALQQRHFVLERLP